MIIRCEDLPKVIENPEKEYIGGCSNVLAIYYPDGENIYLKELNGIEVLADIETIKGGFVKVIVDNPLEGSVYCWGSYGEFWEKRGVTCGYA